MNYEPNPTGEQPSQPSLIDRIRSRLAAGVDVKPRRFFVMRTALLAIGTALVGLVLLYVASFAVFSLRASGAWFAPAAGWRGVGALLHSLPWLVLLLAVAFVALLEAMVRRYAVAYRMPLLYSALGLVVLVAVGSLALSRSPLHTAPFRWAAEGRLPIAGEVYRQAGAPRLRDVHRGVVGEVTPAGFVLVTRRGDRLSVATDTAAHGVIFELGDEVLVLGSRDGAAVAAWDVRTIPGDLPPPPMMVGGERYRGVHP